MSRTRKERAEKELEALVFKVYPERKRLHLDVYVWANRRDMRTYLKTSYPGKGLRNVLACVLWPVDTLHKPRKGYVGEMHFNREDLQMEIIRHEAVHAAIRWAKYVGLDVDTDVLQPTASDTEERFCYAVGNIVDQIEYVLMAHEYK